MLTLWVVSVLDTLADRIKRIGGRIAQYAVARENHKRRGSYPYRRRMSNEDYQHLNDYSQKYRPSSGN
jgi:hypothetical protein